MDNPSLQLATIVSAPFDQNTYVAHLEGRDDCIVVDPGTQPDKILAYLEHTGLQPGAVIITHGHADHIAGNQVLKTRFPTCPLVIGRKDAPKLADPRLNLSAQYGLPLTSPSADVLVDEGDVYRAAGFELEVREVPGHSIGHVIFIWQAGSPVVVFGGDVLFAGGIGRFDFPDGSFEALTTAIHAKLFTLPDDTIVLPGHGPPTTVGEEKRTNPYVGGM